VEQALESCHAGACTVLIGGVLGMICLAACVLKNKSVLGKDFGCKAS
jgi:hypothetical protein